MRMSATKWSNYCILFLFTATRCSNYSVLCSGWSSGWGWRFVLQQLFSLWALQLRCRFRVRNEAVALFTQTPARESRGNNLVNIAWKEGKGETVKGESGWVKYIFVYVLEYDHEYNNAYLFELTNILGLLVWQ